MRARSYVKTSLIQMRTNLVRTLLTLLGIVFGVASVIAMVTIGEGAQRQILKNIEAMGATLVHVLPTGVTPAQVSQIIDRSRGLTVMDVLALRETLPLGGRSVTYFEKVALKVSNLGAQTTDLTILAVDEQFTHTVGLAVVRGTGFTANLVARAAPVAVVSEGFARRFLGGTEGAVGQRVRLDYRWFEVIGVVASTKATAAGAAVQPQSPRSQEKKDGAGAHPAGSGYGPTTESAPRSSESTPPPESQVELPVAIREYEEALFLPLSTVHSALTPPPRYGEIEHILVGCRSLEETNRVRDVVARVLTVTHGGVIDYRIVSPQELLDQQKATQSIFNIVLLSIAAISLVVGGIGIMNIMLANVMERQGEIGIRRALGARKRHIVIQFLSESTAISLVGGVLGVVLGVGISFGILRFTRIPVAFSATPIVLSFGISLTVGIVFGLLPARRAADINPIEALHSE